jgi:hypothetical protein
VFPGGAGYLNGRGALKDTDAMPADEVALSPTAVYKCGAAGGRGYVKVSHAANPFF